MRPGIRAVGTGRNPLRVPPRRFPVRQAFCSIRVIRPAETPHMNLCPTAPLHLLLHAASGFRGKIATILFLGTFRTGCGLLFVGCSRRLIDLAASDTSAPLLAPALGLAAASAFGIACSLGQGYTTARTEVRMANRLRRRLFGRAVGSVWNGRERLHTGDTADRLGEDVRLVAECCCRTLPGCVNDLLQAGGAFLFLCMLHAGLAAGVTVLLAACLLAARGTSRRIKRLSTAIRRAEGGSQALMQESLRKRVVLLALRRTSTAVARLATLQREVRRMTDRRARMTRRMRGLLLAGFGAGYLAVFIGGALLLRHGTVTVGTLAAFIQLVGLLQRPAADLGHKAPEVVRAAASAERLEEIGQLDPEDEVTPNDALNFNRLNGISCRNITFAYPNGRRNILERFTHDFRPGSTTAVIGLTGAGKSTLIRLLLGLLRPQEGSVTLYGEGCRPVEASAAARRALVYVPQGNSLLSGTIRENLRAGNRHASELEMRRALYSAAADFVDLLPLGLDTPCGEGGEGLSEGQAQRIAIARALLGQGRILLFDEFSSALDPATERLLMERLTACTAGRTLLFVTHRAEVVRRCRHVVRLTRREGGEEPPGRGDPHPADT